MRQTDFLSSALLVALRGAPMEDYLRINYYGTLRAKKYP
jgi:hypothetical protein